MLHFLVLPQIGGTRRAISLLSGLRPPFLIAAAILEIGALVAYAQLSRSLLPAEDRPKLWVMVRVVLASLSVNHVVPGGAAAGGVLQYRLMTRAGADPARVGFAMAAQSVGSAIVLNVLLWLALVASIPTSGFQPVYGIVALVGAALLGLAGTAVLALTHGRRRTLGVLTRLADRTPRVDSARVEAAVERAAAQLGVLIAEPRTAATAIGWATANWVLDAAVLWTFLAAFGHAPSVPGLLVAYGLANVLAAIPISPGGLGVVETALIVSLVGFGVPRGIAGLAVGGYRVVQFWLPIPAGALAWVSLMGGRGRDALLEMTAAALDDAPES